jgi:hypothetical protein
MEREGAEPARILAHAWMTSDFFMISPKASRRRDWLAISDGEDSERALLRAWQAERGQTWMGRLYRHSALLERGKASERAIELHVIAPSRGGAPSKMGDSHLRTARRRVTLCRRCFRRTRTSEKIVRSARRPSSQSCPPRRNLSSWQKYSVHGITKIRIAVNRMSKRPPRAYA